MTKQENKDIVLEMKKAVQVRPWEWFPVLGTLAYHARVRMAANKSKDQVFAKKVIARRWPRMPRSFVVVLVLRIIQPGTNAREANRKINNVINALKQKGEW